MVHLRERKMDVEAILIHGKLKRGEKDEPPPQKKSRIDVSDDQFRRMIKETFLEEPTPVEAVRAVLNWTKKETSTAVKRVGCHPGRAGRMAKAGKEKMISALRQWLQENGIL